MSPSDDADFFTKLVSVNLERNDIDAAIASLETAAGRTATAEQRSRVAAAGARLIERFERGDDASRVARVREVLRGVSERAAGRAADAPRSVVPRHPREAPGSRAAPAGVGPNDSDSLEIVRRLLVSPELVDRLRELVHPRETGAAARGPLSLPVADVVAKLLSLDLDVSRTAEVALDLVVAATGADRGFLILAGGSLSFGMEGSPVRPPEASEGILREVLETSATVLVEDALTDPRFGERGSVRDLGVRSVLAVPVRDPASASVT
ncbi:GAF domain-containing protein, partial [bacterium]|nr:GAF domain-containing protein [bacterium]